MTRYLTRMLIDIQADDPIDAVEQYKEKLRTVPDDEWIYRVEDPETDKMFYVFQGEIYTLEQVQRVALPPEEIERIQAAQRASSE